MDTQNQTNVPTLQTAIALTLAMFKEDEQFSFVRPYVAANCTNVEGYRHAVIRYRVTGTDKVEKPAKMATIPSIVLPEDSYKLPDDAKKVLIGVLEDQQDAIIRTIIDDKKDIVDWSSVNLQATLNALTATRVSNRLTRDGIENWFNASVVKTAAELRGEQVAEQKGFAKGSEQWNKQVAGSVQAYRDNFGKLAAAVPNLGQNTAVALQNILKTSEAADDMALALGKKLHQILNPVVVGDGDL